MQQQKHSLCKKMLPKQNLILLALIISLTSLSIPSYQSPFDDTISLYNDGISPRTKKQQSFASLDSVYASFTEVEPLELFQQKEEFIEAINLHHQVDYPTKSAHDFFTLQLPPHALRSVIDVIHDVVPQDDLDAIINHGENAESSENSGLESSDHHGESAQKLEDEPLFRETKSFVYMMTQSESRSDDDHCKFKLRIRSLDALHVFVEKSYIENINLVIDYHEKSSTGYIYEIQNMGSHNCILSWSSDCFNCLKTNQKKVTGQQDMDKKNQLMETLEAQMEGIMTFKMQVDYAQMRVSFDYTNVTNRLILFLVVEMVAILTVGIAQIVVFRSQMKSNRLQIL